MILLSVGMLENRGLYYTVHYKVQSTGKNTLELYHILLKWPHSFLLRVFILAVFCVSELQWVKRVYPAAASDHRRMRSCQPHTVIGEIMYLQTPTNPVAPWE